MTLQSLRRKLLTRPCFAVARRAPANISQRLRKISATSSIKLIWGAIPAGAFLTGGLTNRNTIRVTGGSGAAHLDRQLPARLNASMTCRPENLSPMGSSSKERIPSEPASHRVETAR